MYNSGGVLKESTRRRKGGCSLSRLYSTGIACLPVLQKRKHIELREFMTYLQTLGVQCLQVQISRTTASNYIPYVFDEHEWNRMVLEADNIE